MRGQAAGDAETKDTRATMNQLARFRDCLGEPSDQIAAVATTYNLHAGPSGDACLKCQTNYNNHVDPTSTSAACGARETSPEKARHRRRIIIAAGPAIRFGA